MPSYCVNMLAQENGDHEVHDTTVERSCLPLREHRKDLGSFASCHGAVRQAGYFFSQTNGCHHCAPACNTG